VAIIDFNSFLIVTVSSPTTLCKVSELLAKYETG